MIKHCQLLCAYVCVLTGRGKKKVRIEPQRLCVCVQLEEGGGSVRQTETLGS